MAKNREKKQKIICEDCGKVINQGYKRLYHKCKKCLLKFRKKKMKEIIKNDKI